MFSHRSASVSEKREPFISTNSTLYSSCSGIRRSLLSREFKYQVSQFEQSFKKSTSKSHKVHEHKTKKQATALVREDEMASWVRKHSGSKERTFCDFTKPEMLVADSWFQQQMKTFSTGDPLTQKLVVEEFIKIGFFTNAVEGSRLLARVESKNKGYYSHDDFLKFLSQVEKTFCLQEHQHQSIREFVHTLGGKRLAKQLLLSRASNFERAAEQIRSLTMLKKKLLPPRRHKVMTASRAPPELNETAVVPAKGGGLMYCVKPRSSKSKLLQYLTPSSSSVSATADSPVGFSGACVSSLEAAAAGPRGGSIDFEGDTLLCAADDDDEDDDEVAERVDAIVQREEALIDSVADLMGEGTKRSTCAAVLDSLTPERCLAAIQSSTSKRFIFNAEKVILHNRSMTPQERARFKNMLTQPPAAAAHSASCRVTPGG